MILLYDDDCGFCRWSVMWALDRDPARRLKPVPIRSPESEGLLAGLEPEARERSIHVIGDDGARSSGGAALRELLDALPGARRLALAASISPRLTDLVYDYVARHRRIISRLMFSRTKRVAAQRLRS